MAKKGFVKFLIGLFVLGLIFGILGFTISFKRINRTRRSNQKAQTERVIDQAEVLDAREESMLEQDIKVYQQKTGLDIVIMTIRDDSLDDYESMRDFAQQTYLDGQYGWNKAGGDGVLYVDNWSTGLTWMCTRGKAKETIDDHTAKYIVNKINKRVNKDPYMAYKLGVRLIGQKGNGGNLFNFHVNPIWFLGIGLVIAILFMVRELRNNVGQDTTVQGTYVPDGGVNLLRKQDIYITSHITRTKIEHDHDNDDFGSDMGGSGGFGGAGGSH